jgi:hypothetical protein
MIYTAPKLLKLLSFVCDLGLRISTYMFRIMMGLYQREPQLQHIEYRLDLAI